MKCFYMHDIIPVLMYLIQKVTHTMVCVSMFLQQHSLRISICNGLKHVGVIING